MIPSIPTMVNLGSGAIRETEEAAPAVVTADRTDIKADSTIETADQT